MKILDELNEKLAKIEERIEILKKNHKAEIEALEDKREATEEVIAILMSFLVEHNGAFATLCLSQSTGGIKAADLKTFAEQTGYDIPPELTAEEETGEADTDDPQTIAAAS